MATTHGSPTTDATDSVSLAKAYQRQERERVYRVTGLRIMDAPPYIIGCPRPGCRFTSSALSDGRAVRNLSAHLVWHMRKEQK